MNSLFLATYFIFFSEQQQQTAPVSLDVPVPISNPRPFYYIITTSQHSFALSLHNKRTLTMSPSLPPAAPSSPSSAHRMTAAAPDSERPGPERRPDEDRRHDRGPRLRAYTIATRMNPYLLYLQHSAEVAGLPVEARGMGDPNLQFWDARALQRKLWYHRDQAQRVFSDDVLLFADAYDSLLEAGAEVILKKFRGLKKCEIVFSGETDCRVACIPGMLGAQASRTAVLAGASAGGGDRSPLSQKPLNETVWPTRYLCSGGFLGKASALREVFKKYTPEAFVLENPSKSEQYYWALVWGKEFQQSSSGLTWFFCKNFGMGSDGDHDLPIFCGSTHWGRRREVDCDFCGTVILLVLA